MCQTRVLIRLSGCLSRLLSGYAGCRDKDLVLSCAVPLSPEAAKINLYTEHNVSAISEMRSRCDSIAGTTKPYAYE